MAPGTVFNDDLDNYGVDDIDVDPFADSGDENTNKADSQSKKRKDASGLGIDEAVAVSKKARIPRVKLDDKKLLSDKGIPRLRKKAGDLKLKGKGHEFSDTARLLSFYQLWLDDLYPKAKFLDALGMVEKAGHTRAMRSARMEWINEGKPKDHADENEDEDLFGNSEGRAATKFPARVAPIFQNNNRPKTPSILNDDLFGENDLYDTIPRNLHHNTGSAITSSNTGNVPDDEDDLDALMAEEEAQRAAPISIFGNGQPLQKLSLRSAEPDDDDLDALMAEAENMSGPRTVAPKADTSKQSRLASNEEDEDLDALIAEAEAGGSVPVTKPGTRINQGNPSTKLSEGLDADEEEAMAEMDGLW